MNDRTFDAYQEQYAAARRLEAEILPRNKTVLFDALDDAGIATVTVEFEGSGDSGQMEKPCARTADDTIISLPSHSAEFEQVYWSHGLQKESMTIAEAVEIMAWRLLGHSHGGWENDDGGFGEVTFNVADRMITLDFNERYTETNYHRHTF